MRIRNKTAFELRQIFPNHLTTSSKFYPLKPKNTFAKHINQTTHWIHWPCCEKIRFFKINTNNNKNGRKIGGGDVRLMF